MAADPLSHSIVLHSETRVSLPARSTGPLASMVGDALALVVCKEPRPAEGRPALLLVDEDRSLLNYLDELLKPHFSVVCTSSETDAASLIASCEFDVIVASVMSAGINGAALYSRAHDVMPHLCDRFIFTSAGRGESPAVTASGRRVLRKPVRLDQWDEALLAVLKQTRSVQFRLVESVFLL